MAIVIGAQVWSMSSFRGDSNTAAKSTNVTDFSVILHNCSFSRGNASTVTTSGAKFYFLKHPPLARRTQKSCSGTGSSPQGSSSSGSNVRNSAQHILRSTIPHCDRHLGEALP